MQNDGQGGVWARRKKFRPHLCPSTAEEVEVLIAKKFKGGFPVILSSGRGAIKLIVQEYWAKDNISIFQFASQCVVSAIQAASITPYSRTNFTSDIILHQWGYTDSGCKSRPFIEDSCDSFLPVGSSVLPLGGRFEIWSLPKILNSRFGAIVWCREENDAEHLREIRDKGTRFGIITKQFYRGLRGINVRFYNIWQSMEFENFKLSKNEYGQILRDIRNWDESYVKRVELSKSAYTYLNQKFLENFLSPVNFRPSKELKSAPVVIMLDPQKLNGEILREGTFQTFHRTESGKQPKKYLIYRFLMDNHLKC